MRWVDGSGKSPCATDLAPLLRRGSWYDPRLSSSLLGAWVDDERREVVLLSRHDVRGGTAVHVVALAEGSVREGCSVEGRLRWAMFGSERSRLQLEFLHAPITAIDDAENGVVAVGMEPMARVFAIHPELSPDAAALAAFARSHRGKAEPVHATVWVRGRPRKNPPRGLDPVHPDDRWPFVIVRLAASPDPRASGD